MRMSSIALVALPATVLGSNMAPLTRRNNATPGHYIVMLKDTASIMSDASALMILKEEPTYTWQTALKGFAAPMDQQTLNAIRQHPDVESVQEDGQIKAAGWTVEGTTSAFPLESRADDWITQEKAIYGLARVSHKTTKQTTYQYHKSQGEGVCAWVMDSGIDAKHTEFEGRAENVKSWIKNEENTDLFNHGTHCAGTIGSKTYGIAKKAKLLSLKVLGRNGSGPDSASIEAMDWLAENGPKRTECKGHVVNMSFTADAYSPAMNKAAAALTKAGMLVAVAAGNSGQDAGKTSPAAEPNVCTVAASDNNDSRASFSNFGKAIDIFAPGNNIQSTIPGNKNSQMSGTSMAAPHIAGLGAVLITQKGINGGQACDELVKLAQKGLIKNAGKDTVNLLAFNGNPNAK